ncbi:MAG: ABC transporter permease [Desulfovibrionaceae bacterium]|nr:ABC transporter permease [Desulfovibrionaceae bacterium]MBF0514991.1 ABC transporter permease [Desulfovibrionaceae bacterium]
MNARGRFSMRFVQVWRRNLIVYKRIWKVNFLPPMLEPIFYLTAFGLGLGSLVKTVPYQGEQVDYMSFIAPGLIASAVMWQSFFETTFASFVRMFYQKTFDAMLSTPLTLEEVIIGEIVWGATKAFIASILVLCVVAAFGGAHLPGALLVPPVAFLGGLAFACAGMCFTGVTPSIDMFNLPMFLFITPMFLFSGTFFPLDNLPAWAGLAAKITPLYHLTSLIRELCLGRLGADAWLSLAYLAAFTALAAALSLRAMRRRLVR